MTFERERYDEGKWPSKWETGGNWERIERESEREKPKGASRISTAEENFIFAPPAKNSGQRTS